MWYKLLADLIKTGHWPFRKDILSSEKYSTIGILWGEFKWQNLDSNTKRHTVKFRFPRKGILLDAEIEDSWHTFKLEDKNGDLLISQLHPSELNRKWPTYVWSEKANGHERGDVCVAQCWRDGSVNQGNELRVQWWKDSLIEPFLSSHLYMGSRNWT